MTRLRVLVTGAAGNLGSQVVAGMSDRYDLTTLDIVPCGAQHQVDLRVYGDWESLCAKQDVVVHLAGDRRPEASWAEALSSNVGATLNVYHAAAERGVGRIVLASSVWAARGAWSGRTIANDVENPGENAYGASKVVCERVARWNWQCRSISTIALRLGGCPPGPARPKRQNPWEDSLWLSPADAMQAISLAVESTVSGCHVVTVTSRNPAEIWDLTAAERVLGYRPLDTWAPPPQRRRLRWR